MAGIARQRLMEERKSFRKNRPFGFFARPCTLPDGTQVCAEDVCKRAALVYLLIFPQKDLMKWECGIPGKDGTLWAGAVFPLTMAFSEVLLHRPHICFFT